LRLGYDVRGTHQAGDQGAVPEARGKRSRGLCHCSKAAVSSLSDCGSWTRTPRTRGLTLPAWKRLGQGSSRDDCTCWPEDPWIRHAALQPRRRRNGDVIPRTGTRTPSACHAAPRGEVPQILTQPTGSFRHRSTQAQLLLGTGVLLHSASKSTLDDRYCNRDQLHRPRQRPTWAPLQRAACTSTRGPRGKPAACFGQPTTTPSI